MYHLFSIKNVSILTYTSFPVQLSIPKGDFAVPIDSYMVIRLKYTRIITKSTLFSPVLLVVQTESMHHRVCMNVLFLAIPKKIFEKKL